MDIEISIQAQTKIDILGPMPKQKEPEIVYSAVELSEVSTLIGENVCEYN